MAIEDFVNLFPNEFCWIRFWYMLLVLLGMPKAPDDKSDEVLGEIAFYNGPGP